MSAVAAGPAPPEGKHRYVFLLWKQLGEVRASAVKERKGWDPVDFAKVGIICGCLVIPVNYIYLICTPVLQAHNLAEAPSACVFFYSQPF